MSAFNSLAFKFCPMCGERLSYTSYEGYCPYAGCHWNNDDNEGEATESTPPASPELVLTQDGGLVAQAAASGGECPSPDWLDLALATCPEHGGVYSAGGLVLLSQYNLAWAAQSQRARLQQRLAWWAERCISAGC